MTPHPVTHWCDTTIVQLGRLLAPALPAGHVPHLRGITRRIHSREPRDGTRHTVVRDITVGGVHIHHQVWGIGLVLGSAFLEFRFQPSSPGWSCSTSPSAPGRRWVAAIRLAKPTSVWARRFYARDPEKMAAAERRHASTEDHMNRLRNFLAGAPAGPRE